MAQAKKLVYPETPDVLLPLQTLGVDKSVLGGDGTTIGQQRKDPLALYGIFLEIVRGFYSPAMEATVGGRRVWRNTTSGVDAGLSEPDRIKTDIWIDTEYKWEDRAPSFRPAIFVALAPLAFSSYTGNYRSLSSIDLENAEYNYSRTVQGSVSIVHLGETKGEGVILGSNTYALLDAFADVIRKDYCFDKFQLTGFVPMQWDSQKSEYRSTITAGFEFQETWTIKKESPKLKAFTFRTRQTIDGLVISVL